MLTFNSQTMDFENATEAVQVTGTAFGGGVRAEVQSARALLGPAGLDWRAEPRAMQTVDGIAIPNRKALVRSDTGAVIGDVGESFGIVQNEALAELADAVRGTDEGWTFAQGAALRGGSRVYLQLRSPTRNVGGEKIEALISLFNGFDGSLMFSAGFSNTVIVCRNTFAIALGDSRDGIALKHTRKIEDRIQQAIGMVTAARHYTDAIDNGVLAMMNRAITTGHMEALAERLIPGDATRAENARNALLRAYFKAPGAAPGTAWGALQAVTYHASHEVSVRATSSRTAMEARQESNWWGRGAELAQDAWGILGDDEQVRQLVRLAA